MDHRAAAQHWLDWLTPFSLDFGRQNGDSMRFRKAPRKGRDPTQQYDATMQYVNFAYEDSDESTLYTGPVPENDAAYLRQAATHLQPLSDEEYMTGPAVILHTMAKFSYVLDGDELYWCVEWQPGLLVVKMTPEGDLQWVALRSPIPNFGGREPLPEDGDPDEYDSGDNPQYNLIFTPWDAQFDKQEREWKSFVPADAEVQARFEKALARVNALGDVMESRYAGDDSWRKVCKENLKKWAGEGVRLKAAS
jgi:hypothetical protein